MPIQNRDLGANLQLTSISQTFGPLATGVTVPVCVIASPCTLSAAKVAAFGLSAAPTVLLSIQRFIVGSGVTSYLGGFTTLTTQAAGTSGAQSVVIAAAGSTALNLLAGDVIMATTGASNAAATGYAIDIVVQYTQDLRSFFGVAP